jgi:phage terminase small subunit
VPKAWRDKAAISPTYARLLQRTSETLNPEELVVRDRFVDALLQGCTKREAAIRAGFCEANGFSEQMANKRGWEMYREAYVQDQLRQLREALEEDKLLSRKELLLNLKEIAFDGRVMGVTRVMASQGLAKICGYDAPTKVEATVQSGVMVVPVSGSVDEWEAAAKDAQKKLQEDAGK